MKNNHHLPLLLPSWLHGKLHLHSKWTASRPWLLHILCQTLAQLLGSSPHRKRKVVIGIATGIDLALPLLGVHASRGIVHVPLRISVTPRDPALRTPRFMGTMSHALITLLGTLHTHLVLSPFIVIVTETLVMVIVTGPAGRTLEVVALPASIPLTHTLGIGATTVWMRMWAASFMTLPSNFATLHASMQSVTEQRGQSFRIPQPSYQSPLPR